MKPAVSTRTAASWLCDHVAEQPQAPVTAAITGPGGTGKSLLLRQVAQRYRRHGIHCVEISPAHPIDISELEADRPLLVDDAHRLPDDTLQRLRSLAQLPQARIVVAYRPWPRSAVLDGLTTVLSQTHPTVVLTHLDAPAIADRIFAGWQVRAPEPLVDLVLAQSGGLPWLADLVTQALIDSGGFDSRRPDEFRRPHRVNLSAGLAQRLRHRIDELDPDVRRLLEALAVGAELDADVLALLLGCDAGELDDTVEAALSTGLLTQSGAIIGFVANLVLTLSPVLARRKLQSRYAQFQLERGGSMLALGERFLADGATGATVAAALEAAGDEALRLRPDLAERLFAAAGTAGAATPRLGSRRAHAAALVGDSATALRLAEEVIGGSGAVTVKTGGSTESGGSTQFGADRQRAVLVAAAVFAQRGVPSRSTQLYLSDATTAVLAAPLLLGAGDVAQTRELLGRADPDGAMSSTPLADAGRRVAAALLASIDTGPAPALAQLNGAITLVEPVGETLVLSATPAAYCAVVATQCGEFEVAETALRRAVAGKLGGRFAHPRHLLLHGWTSMLAGQPVRARRALDRVTATASEPGRSLQPADELLAAALQAGLARRDSGGAVGADATDAVAVAWRRGKYALLDYPVDLYCLAPLGELAVAAAVVGDIDGVSAYLDQADTVLSTLGDPPLWSVPLHWYRLHAALEISDSEQAHHYAKLLNGVGVGVGHGYASALAAAAAAWVGLMDGGVNPTAVLGATQLLGGVGLSTEGARLASQAATMAAPKDAAALLGAARSLRGAASSQLSNHASTHPSTTALTSPRRQDVHADTDTDTGSGTDVDTVDHGATPPHDCILSVRELEVGRLVLAGLTHKQIGGKLFISAKTVEHHVARIRQRLDVNSRTELFGRLNELLTKAALPR